MYTDLGRPGDTFAVAGDRGLSVRERVAVTRPNCSWTSGHRPQVTLSY